MISDDPVWVGICQDRVTKRVETMAALRAVGAEGRSEVETAAEPVGWLWWLW